MSGEEDLPPGWTKKESRSRPGTFYYYNVETRESVWEKPTESASTGSNYSLEVRVLHLLKKHKGSRRPASWRKDPITCTKEEAIQELTALRDQIVAASDQRAKFEELARVESDCSSAKSGGDLGMFCRGNMQKPFEDASFALNVNELSGIVDTDSGVHIIYRIA